MNRIEQKKTAYAGIHTFQFGYDRVSPWSVCSRGVLLTGT